MVKGTDIYVSFCMFVSFLLLWGHSEGGEVQGSEGVEDSAFIEKLSDAAIQIRIRIVRYQWPAKRQKRKLCENRPVLFPHFSLLVVRNWSWKGPKRGQFHAAIRLTILTLRFVCPRSDSCDNLTLRFVQGAQGEGQYRSETFAMRNR